MPFLKPPVGGQRVRGFGSHFLALQALFAVLTSELRRHGFEIQTMLLVRGVDEIDIPEALEQECHALVAVAAVRISIAAATAAVEGELARSRAAAIRAIPLNASIAAAPVIEALVGVVSRTEFGARLVFEVDAPEDMRVPVAEEDLMELMGALLENAARFAHRRVRITGISSASALLTVEDGGPGIGSEQMAEAVMRGGRLDEAGSGHGLGLAIAHDLVEATRGEITLFRSELGGLKVAVSWRNVGY